MFGLFNRNKKELPKVFSETAELLKSFYPGLVYIKTVVIKDSSDSYTTRKGYTQIVFEADNFNHRAIAHIKDFFNFDCIINGNGSSITVHLMKENTRIEITCQCPT